MKTTQRTGVLARAAAVAALTSVTGLALASADPASIAVIEIEGTPAARSSGMAWLGDADRTLRDYVETFDTLAYDDEFAGVMVRLKDAALSMTQVEELGAALDRVRDEGKKVHVFAEGYGPGEIMLGAHADEVIVQSGGMVSLPGLHMEEMFLADTLSWVGVKAQLVQVGDYKGANEQMTRSEPSPAWNENIDGLLDSLYANQRSIIKSGRHMDDAELDDAMKLAWWADADEGIEAGLIDAAVDLPMLPKHLEGVYGTKIKWVKDPYTVDHAVDMSNPFVAISKIFSADNAIHVDSPSIAVLHIDGTIVDGDSSSGGMFGGGEMVGSRTIRNAIEDILKEDLIKGVVVRIDSPGGSAIASEVMWQGLDRLKTEKPVWVSVGSMAASGGYYVLSAGQKVYVNPSSIVGSIGVVGGKYAMGGLYDKLKVNIVERSRGPAASLNSSVTPWTDAEQALVRLKMSQTYDLFTQRVTAGRQGIDLSKTAEGRLFTGNKAIGMHMADELGGLDDAITDLALDLDMDDYDVVEYPAPPSFEEMIERMLGGFVKAPSVAQSAAAANPLAATLEGVLGTDRFNAIRDSLNAMALLRDEPVLLTSPRAIIVK
ncbi:MAG: S49 family peptidase [Phycisphaerales bacterium]